jgi:hypothetical protein
MQPQALWQLVAMVVPAAWVGSVVMDLPEQTISVVLAAPAERVVLQRQVLQLQFKRVVWSVKIF